MSLLIVQSFLCFFVSVITLSPPPLSIYCVSYLFSLYSFCYFRAWLCSFFLNVGIHLIGLFYLKEGRWFCDFKGFFSSRGLILGGILLFGRFVIMG